jgi:carboxylesterase
MMKTPAPSETGCLLLHGYAGRPFEMSFLAEHLAAAGYCVDVPVLAGHDDDAEAFSRSRFMDWLASAGQALDRLEATCRQVVVAGFSMGGTLALALAQQRALAGVVTIAAPVFLCRLHPYFSPDPLLFASGILRHFRSSLPASPPKAESRRIAPWKGYEGTHYVEPLHSFKVAAAEVRRGLHRVTSPVLALHGTRDRAVHPDNAWEILTRVSSARRELHMLPVRETVTSGHLIVTHEETRGLAGSLVLEFVRSLADR